MKLTKLKLKGLWNRTVHLISDIYYRKDRSTTYEHKLSLWVKPSWRDRCRNPVTGIFNRFLF